jgi:6-phosphofructokinase 1
VARRVKTKCIGILTAGGDCPGLNAAIRGVAKAVIADHGMKVIGILDGFRGLVENRTIPLDDRAVSGILTLGGTILGTSRDKPHKMAMGGKIIDMTEAAVSNAHRLGIDCLVCLGGGGTQKNALQLQNAGLNVLTLPKTIDNDVGGTDISFGFDTAMSIATEAIDRLHTTATSHNRLIVCEVMGHSAGWLALGSGIAGGADVILIPEIPYRLSTVAEHLLERRRAGKRFSIIAVAEAAHALEESRTVILPKDELSPKPKGRRKHKDPDGAGWNDVARSTTASWVPPPLEQDEVPIGSINIVQEPMASRLARQLQQMTGTEARVTSLGHVQRGGSPTPTDRLLCTRLGVAAAQLLADGVYGVMVAVHGDRCEPVPLEATAGKANPVPPDHSWIDTARRVGTCLGDR